MVNEWKIYRNTNTVSGLVPGNTPKSSSDTIKYLGEFDSSQACWAACNASSFGCPAWAWHSPEFDDPQWRRQCYSRLDGGFDDVPQQGIESAWGPHSIGGGFAFSSKRGGNQGGEGNDGAGEWFVTNVVEELDSDNEFW